MSLDQPHPDIWRRELSFSDTAEAASSLMHVYDCIGIGFGPSNIALAIALEEIGALDNCLFLEARDCIAWQPGMLLEGSDIQHNPLRDFVTPRNPRSAYGFLSYLAAKDRLFEFLNLDAPFPPRIEYAGYVAWVAEQFAHAVRLNVRVDGIDVVEDPQRGRLLMVSTRSGSYLVRTVSFGPGRSAHIPEVFAPHLGPRVVHLTDYLWSIERWKDEGLKRFVVIGGSQSAAEIVLDLAGRAPDYEITSISRNFGFKLKDVSPFTERIYMPEFVDYFFEAPEDIQHAMTQELWRSNYGAADHDVIVALQMHLYEQKVSGHERIKILSNQTTNSVSSLPFGDLFLRLTDRCDRSTCDIYADAVILATGFQNFGSGEKREAYHPLLKALVPVMRFRADGGVVVKRDFSLGYASDAGPMPQIFLNGVCEATHGFGDAGSFSLLSTRSAHIAEAIQRACRETALPETCHGASPD